MKISDIWKLTKLSFMLGIFLGDGTISFRFKDIFHFYKNWFAINKDDNKVKW